MQKTTVFVFVAMVALASAAKSPLDQQSADEIRKIGELLEKINKYNWKLVNHLIDNQQTICISKKVILNGIEIKKANISNLLKAFSRTQWGKLYQLIIKHQTDVVNRILKDGRKVNVAEILLQIERMMKVNWANYYESYAIICMSPASRRYSPSTPKTPTSPEMDEQEKTKLEIAQRVRRKDNFDWGKFESSKSK